MNVLLLNPPYPVCETLTMPLGLLYLAARLERAGHRVVLADLQLSGAPVRNLRGILETLPFHMVGTTSFSVNVPAASRLLRAAKTAYPELLAVWGGPHASFDDEGLLAAHPWVDAAVRGEGEETLVELLAAREAGRGPGGVPGVTWRRGGGAVARNPSRPLRAAMDELPTPAWHLLELSKYRAFGEGASLMTSRGCPHRCLFCVGRKMVGSRGRFRSPTAVVDEMESLVRLGFRRIRVEDDLFTFHRKRALTICREVVRRGLEIQWRGYARVDTVDPELLHWMRRSGCERLLFGAESGSPEILRNIRKGISPEQTRRAVEMTRQAGIQVLASFVLGLPGETPRTLRETLRFARSLGVPFSLNLLTPYLGTEVREQAHELGLRILSHDWALYGQGKPLTATPTVGPWHLSRAVGEFRRGVARYLEQLLEGERMGSLTPETASELRRHRRRSFLRRVIRDDLLEKHGAISPSSHDNSLEELSLALARASRLPPSEVLEHLRPLAREGHIRLAHSRGPGGRWEWT